MNEIINATNEEIVTMTSLDLVDLINKFRFEEGSSVIKEHKILMRDIRTETEYLRDAGIKSENNFVPGSYIDKNNQQRPCFKMNKAGIMQMLNKESALVRYKTQQYIEALENKMKESEKPSCIEDVLISSLKEMKAMKQQVNQATHHHALSAKAEVKEIREIVSLDTTSWRKDTQNLINKIAVNQGGCSHINLLR